MLRTLSGLILAVTCLQSQPLSSLLLSQAHHIVGTVVDSEGKPVADARIDHSNDRLKGHQTDPNGRFELDTQAPAVVIRKAGFQSALVATKDAGDVRITLKKLTENRPFPSCSKKGPYQGIEGWGAAFQFQKVPGVKASSQGQDIDYGARSYYIRTPQGRKGIMHGSGGMWTFGIPIDQDVWRSVTYSEIVYDFAGLTVLDARGAFESGNRWRYLGKFSESASYSNADPATADTLDRFLDGACLKSTPLPKQ
jgi:hypothetical protein